MSYANSTKTMTNKQSNASRLFWGGIAFTGIVSLWPVLMVASEVAGTMDEQLQQIALAPNLYLLNYFVASLIAPAIMVLMFAYISLDIPRRLPLNARMEKLFLGLYAALVSVAYVSQYTWLPRLLGADKMELARQWYFGNGASISYFLNQLGYFCFGAAALMVGYKLFFGSGISRTIGGFLWASGLLSLVAFLGLLLQIEAQGFASIISGLLTLPIGVLSIIWGKKLNKGD